MTLSEIVSLAAVLISVGINIGLYVHLSSVMNSRFDSLNARMSSLESRMASFEATMTARFDLLMGRMAELKKDIHDK